MSNRKNGNGTTITESNGTMERQAMERQALNREPLTLAQRIMRAANPTDKPLTVKVTLFDPNTGDYIPATVPADSLRETTSEALQALVHNAAVVVTAVPVGGKFVGENGKPKRDKFSRPVRGELVSDSLAQSTVPAL